MGYLDDNLRSDRHISILSFAGKEMTSSQERCYRRANPMKKLLSVLLPSLAVLSFLAMPAAAHRSGCHSWHSCPSDSGSYVCGDTGHCSGCSDNQYCQNGSYSPVATRAKPTPAPVVVPVQAPVVAPTPVPLPKSVPIVVPVSSAPTPLPVAPKPVVKVPTYFVGTPKTYAQLFNCRIVGNGASKIYHLQGSRFIKSMNLKSKTCFETEAAAKAKGYRKSKT